MDSLIGTTKLSSPALPNPRCTVFARARYQPQMGAVPDSDRIISAAYCGVALSCGGV